VVWYRCFGEGERGDFFFVALLGLELHHEAAERRPVRHALAPLPGAEAVGGRRRGGGAEALHHAALVAPPAGARRRVVRVRRRHRSLVRLLLLLLDGGVPLPDAELARGAHDLRVHGNITMLLQITHTAEWGIVLTLQPREQKRNVSRRLRSQTSQVLVTPLPGLGCGRSFRNTTRALLMM
jgi:hypothetical protein